MSVISDWLSSITLASVITASQWFFLLYFILLALGYLSLNLSALSVIRRHSRAGQREHLPQPYYPLLPPVSVLVPAYNEEANITASVQAMLQLTYPEHEVIVINDGSKDGTLAELIRAFDLHVIPETTGDSLPTAAVEAVYRSRSHPSLRVIDKLNGGKADALNAGINYSRYPLFCGVDADSIIQRDSLLRIVRAFLDDPDTIAAGGTVRIANGSHIDDGVLLEAKLPTRWLPLIQVLEYLRAFLFGRLGWEPVNGLLIISGAFGVFSKEAVMEVGGYRHKTIGEDMELVVRLHRFFRQQRRPYRIHFVPDPVCWTEAPENLASLRSQRIRWQRGLLESLAANWRLCFNRRGGVVGWLAFPFMLLFEVLGPIIELIGYVFFIVAFLTGALQLSSFLAFLLVAIGLGVLMSVTALLIEEMSFRVYPGQRPIFKLFGVALVENFGYRQMTTWWRVRGTFQWLRGRQGQWGTIQRSGSLHTTKAKKPDEPLPPSSQAGDDQSPH